MSGRQSRIAGRRGVVVGGASGIGRAVVAELAAAGAEVVVADLDGEGAERAAREAGAAAAECCDVRDEAGVRALAERAARRLGGVDFLVVTVGITQSGGIVASDSAAWGDLLDTNVLGVARALRAFVPELERGHDGQAVVVASLSGRETYAGQPMYIASKWGVVGLVHSVRKELQASGLRVSVVAPGLVDTPMSRGNPHARRLFDEVRALDPADVAAAVTFVLDQPPHVLVREIALQPVEQAI